ncbi:MAG: phytoene/squalene synthase family protein [Magnetococcales bacterium]|nr:phytoene/squalene synthase family protein [Magnetococcales bacterium]
MKSAAAFCRSQVWHANSSFFYAMVLMPTQSRRAVFAVYSFCRLVDDSVDLPLTTGHWHAQRKQAKLAWWRREVHHLLSDRTTTHPVSAELLWAHDQFAIDIRLLLDILDGMEMDLQPRWCQTWDDLERYCRRVAVAVGQLIIPMMRRNQQHSAPPMDHLSYPIGMALQLTNILRDLAEDAAMGRIYLPQQWLQQAGIDRDELLANRHWPPQLQSRLQPLLRQLATTARNYYDQAEQMIPAEERAELLPARLMAAFYRHCLDQLDQHHYDVFQYPVRLGLLTKMGLCWRTWRDNR